MTSFSPEGIAVNGRRPSKKAAPKAASNILPFPTPVVPGVKMEKPSVELRYAHSFIANPLMRIGGMLSASQGGLMDRTFHAWTENNHGEAYWKVFAPDERTLHALQWLQVHACSKATEREAKAAANTASLLATAEETKWVRQPAGTVIGVRGAYLHLKRQGNAVKFFAELPSKDAGLTYVVPATFDWKRVAKDGTYTPRAVDPASKFGQYLDRFMPDLEVRALLQEAVGSTVLARAIEKAFWLQGEGSNGKSTLLHILRKLHPRNTALDLAQITGRFGTVPLIGTTLATVSECPEFFGTEVEQKIKAIVSRDPITVEEKFGGVLTIVPRASLFLLFNKAPRVTDHSYGFWSKVLAIPFSVQLKRDSAERVTDYHKLITENPEEMSAVLDWVLEGALRLEARGNFPSTLPAAAVALSHLQRHSADNVLQYLEANGAIHDPNVRTLMPKVYEDYVRFCVATGVKPVQYNEFWVRTRDHFKPNDLGHAQAPTQQDGKRPRTVHLRVDGVAALAVRAP
jgi:hypothetical protein